jgi:tetratricopeptide (TPR) repeat protein
MMRRYWMAAMAAVALVAAFSLLAMQREAAWSTEDPAALREFEAGLEDTMKLYRRDAAEHFNKAVEIDPGFLVAKLFAYKNRRMLPPEARRVTDVMEELRRADLSSLTDRERFLIRFHLALERSPEEAVDIAGRYLESHFQDPFALNAKLDYHWKRGELDQAEQIARQLIEADPNNAIAYNNLGYLAMSQGRFAESEDMLLTYRFLAPHQANPHDSLGELYLLTGRYGEAQASFERALATRPDFTASYEHLLKAAVEQGEFVEADAVIERMRQLEAYPREWTLQHEAYVTLWQRVWETGWQAAWRYVNDGLPGTVEPRGDLLRAIHLVACKVGELETARRLEADLAARYRSKGSQMENGASHSPVLGYLEAVSQAADGDLAKAVSLMHSVDKRLSYMASEGRMKLCNRLQMSDVLAALGDQQGASALRRQVELVNPRLVERHEALGCSVVPTR